MDDDGLVELAWLIHQKVVELEMTIDVVGDDVALVLDVDPGAFDVAVVPDIASVELSDEAREGIEVQRSLRELSERARRHTPVAVAELRAAGLTVRDVARLLALTPSRVSQIEAGHHRR